MNFRANMNALRNLSDDHYQNRISFVEYREKRKELLRMIDDDLNGIKVIEDDVIKLEDSIIEKALSFLKIDKLKETN